MNKLPGILAICASAALAPPLAAQEAASQDEILACVAQMDAGTSWDQCRTMIFQGCAGEDVGSEPHLECLTTERDAWEKTMQAAFTDLNEKLTPQASTELTDLMGQWVGFVGQKCAAVGAERADISEGAAITGCQISELVGLTNELGACAAGNSTAPYCVLKEN